MRSLARFVFRHRRGVLLSFVALTVAAALYGRKTAAELVAGGFHDPTSESSHADLLLEERFQMGTPDVVVAYSHPALRVHDREFAAILQPALARMRAQPGVERISTPYGERPDALVSKDGHVTLIALRLAGRGHEAQDSYERLAPLLELKGLKAAIGGEIPGARQAQQAAEADLLRAELITLPLVAVLLVIFFRGLVVALLPLLMGGFAVAAALACIRLLTHVSDVSIFAMNIVTFVGLGVAIDYSLFMAMRFRDELAAGASPERALEHTLQTSGRTIAYSGAAVAVSLLSLAVFPLALLRSIAFAGALVVLMSLLGALLFLPALLAALGPRIERFSLPRPKPSALMQRFWRGVAAVVMRSPWLVTALVTGLLVLLGWPFLGVKSAVAGASALPAEAPARQVAELLESDRFPVGAVSSVQVFATLPEPVLSRQGLERVERYVAQLRAVPHVARVEAAAGASGGPSAAQLSALLESDAGPGVRARLSPLVDGQDTAIRVELAVEPSSDAAQAVVRAVREVREQGVQAVSTSPAARLLDLKATLYERLPWALGIVVLATFVVLFLAFGSVVMPIKAILMNVLSLTASFGALVWVFQEGRFERLLGFRSPGYIELTIPVIMFAVVFGLAMDYELFLLSRIREAYDQTGDTRESVSQGLSRTGQLITRAALLLVAVMIGFISADMLLVKEMGVGMAVAIIVDATIVRALLVPATMQLLGAYNWWAPPGLSRWWKRSHLGVDESEPIVASEPVAAPG
jgi:trehalose monomycolate/heme transporter